MEAKGSKNLKDEQNEAGTKRLLKSRREIMDLDGRIHSQVIVIQYVFICGLKSLTSFISLTEFNKIYLQNSDT